MENQSCNMIFSPLSMKLAVLITAEAGDNGLQYETRKVLPLTLYADLFRRWRSLVYESNSSNQVLSLFISDDIYVYNHFFMLTKRKNEMTSNSIWAQSCT